MNWCLVIWLESVVTLRRADPGWFGFLMILVGVSFDFGRFRFGFILVVRVFSLASLGILVFVDFW